MHKLSALVVVFAFGLLHCGATLPVKAVFVSCADKTPVANAQIHRLDSTTRTHADGTWDSTSIGRGSYHVEVVAEGYKDRKAELTPGDPVTTVCLTPE